MTEIQKDFVRDARLSLMQLQMTIPVYLEDYQKVTDIIGQLEDIIIKKQ